MTDEVHDIESSDGTQESLAGELGVEARAEYQRLRDRLGLRADDEAPESALASLGRYRLERELGRGGMGVVYRAKDPELGRPVAIKLVRGLAFSATNKLRARLLREAKVLAQLTHPNVVRIYDVGSHDGEVYLAMEYVDGQTLLEWQQGRARGEIIDAYIQAAQGLAAAHDMGIVHRDFKADNVFVAKDGRILVADFGLAGGVAPDEAETAVSGLSAEAESQGVVTRTGALLGTLAYMAPEQLRGDSATPSSDQFALCVSLWEAMTGRRPFAGKDPLQLLEAIERGVPPRAEGISKKLYRVLERGLSADPKGRYEDVRALAGALERLRRRPTWLFVGLALVGVSLGTWALTASQEAEMPTIEQCDLRDAQGAVVEDSDAWRTSCEYLAGRGMEDVLPLLELHLDRIRREIDVLCGQPYSVEGEARVQHLQRWVEDVEGFLNTIEGRSEADIREDIGDMVRARLTGPPPRSLARDVVYHLKQSRQLERQGDLEAALRYANQAVEHAGGRLVELAVAEQRRGRVLALYGKPNDALEAYGRAKYAAIGSGYDDALLEIELLAAKTAVMRREDLDLASYALAGAEGVFRSLPEPSLSLRRADYHELQASLRKRRGTPEDYGQAFRHQWISLGQRLLLGDATHVGLGLLNLGTLHEHRRADDLDLSLARSYYERAVDVLPPASLEGAQASYNLGRWIINDSEDPEEWSHAKLLLEKAREVSKDLWPPATAILLKCAIDAQEVEDARTLAAALREYLVANPSSSEIDGFTYWQTIAFEAAYAADRVALDHAVAEVDHHAELIRLRRSKPAPALEEERAGFEASLAIMSENSDLALAISFARRAMARIERLTPTPVLIDMREEAQRILARGSG